VPWQRVCSATVAGRPTPVCGPSRYDTGRAQMGDPCDCTRSSEKLGASDDCGNGGDRTGQGSRCLRAQLPDGLPAVPFVDHILWSAFDISLWVGLALWGGCLLLVSPIVFVPKPERSTLHYVFASCWLTLIAAGAMGAYPTPIVGYGASAIIGYFLSLLFLQPRARGRMAVGEGPTDLSESEETIPPLRNSPASLAI